MSRALALKSFNLHVQPPCDPAPRPAHNPQRLASQTKSAKPQPFGKKAFQNRVKAQILHPRVEWPAEAFDFSDVETV